MFIKTKPMSKKTGNSMYNVDVETDYGKFSGILLPDSTKQIFHIKLDSGYNIRVDKKAIMNYKKKILPKKNNQVLRHNKNTKLPKILILHTGGTIVSKVDYRTGAVTPQFTTEDLLAMFPELSEIANIKTELLFQKFSENINPEDWQELARGITKHLNDDIKGILITHGTDTLHYTSAALSFMIQNPRIPIILVGSQRSPDRGSSDSYLNIICAIKFAVKSNFKGVGVCMHASTNDDFCYILPGTKVRKMHTSRRDAFRSINASPYAKIDRAGIIEYLSDYPKEGKTIIKTNLNKKTALIKVYPGFSINVLNGLKGYKGLVIEGTGLGHVNNNLFSKLKTLSKSMVIVIASQCIFGRTNLNVYSTGRDLQNFGIIGVEDMLPEVAYIKLMWLLGHIKDFDKVKKEFLKNYVGEINQRLQVDNYL